MTSDHVKADVIGYTLYRSTAVRTPSGVQLDAILTTARDRNRALGLTGCLHYESGLFFQWLEGPKDALREVITSISNDSRHRDMVILVEGTLPERRFEDWEMRFSDPKSASLLDWLAGAQVSTLDRRHYADGVMTFLQSVAA